MLGGLLATALLAPARTPRSYVDPLIGTGGLMYGVGGDPPGAQRPFGLVKFSPDTTPSNPALWTEFEHYSGTAYMDEYVNAFSLLHMVGPGALDLGTLGVMPIGQASKALALHGAKARYSHDNETAAPGLYSATLTPAGADSPVLVELTATLHAAIMRLTPKPDSDREQHRPETLTMLIDPRHTLQNSLPKVEPGQGAVNISISIDAKAGTISGHVIDVGGLSSRIPSSASPAPFVPGDASPKQGGLDLWFHVVFPGGKLDPTCSGIAENGKLRYAADAPWAPLTATGNVSAFACLPCPSDGEKDSVTAAIGVSTIDATHAKHNLQAEGAERNFDEIAAEAGADWDMRMSVIELVDEADEELLDEELLTPFYTALYHVHQAPSTYSEPGGDYLGFDMTPHTLQRQNDSMLSDMSIWDTHRSWNPLMVLLQQDVATAVVRSLERMTTEGGAVPRWPLAHGYTHCMIGNHAGSIVLDSWVKGIRDFDVDALYAGLHRAASQLTPQVAAGRYDLKDYLASGYCVSDDDSPAAKWAAACTLAYAYDDWALSTLAQTLGKPQEVVELFRNRSKSYHNTFDKKSGYFCPRFRNGSFACPKEFAPTSIVDRAEFGGDKVQGYAEGDAAQCTNTRESKFASCSCEVFELFERLY